MILGILAHYRVPTVAGKFLEAGEICDTFKIGRDGRFDVHFENVQSGSHHFQDSIDSLCHWCSEMRIVLLPDPHSDLKILAEPQLR